MLPLGRAIVREHYGRPPILKHLLQALSFLLEFEWLIISRIAERYYISCVCTYEFELTQSTNRRKCSFDMQTPFTCGERCSSRISPAALSLFC